MSAGPTYCGHETVDAVGHEAMCVHTLPCPHHGYGEAEIQDVRPPKGSVVLPPFAAATVRMMVRSLCAQAKRYGSLLSMDASEEALNNAKENYEAERDLLLARLTNTEDQP